jgi:hypothetical protein
LAQLLLPYIHGPGGVIFDSFFQEKKTFSNLRYVTFDIVPLAIAVRVISSIIRMLCTSKLHFRLLTFGAEDRSILLRRPSVSRLFSVATTLTFQDCDFRSGGIYFGHISLPCLRALALIDCLDACLFFYVLQATCFPQLSAFMFEGESLLMVNPLQDFIKNLASLRELIICGILVTWCDPGIINSHANTLELLVLSREDNDLKTMLYPLTAIRHLCLSFGEFLAVGRQGKLAKSQSGVQALLVSQSAVVGKLQESLTKTGRTFNAQLPSNLAFSMPF